MDLPCAEWIKHAEHKWRRMDSARRESFDLLTDIDELYHYGHSLVQHEDLKALYRIAEKCSVKKSPENAARFREHGNTSFKLKDYTSATLYYTKGVSHAGKNTEQLSLCYANRSAALFHLGLYDKCLEDIQRAFDDGYPSHLHCKLLDRRTQCISKLEKQKCLKTPHSECQTPQVENRKDGKTSLFSAVSVHFSPAKGRYLVATENKSAGEVMVEDEAFSLVLIPGTGHSNKASTYSIEHRHCHHCLCESLSSVPCLGCSYALYCGQRCEREAWRQYHQWECPAGSELLALGLFAHLALRVTLKAGIKEVKRARKSCFISFDDEPVTTCVSNDGKKSGCCEETTKSVVGVPSELNVEETESSDHSSCFHGKSYMAIYSLVPHVIKHSPNLRFLFAFTMATLSHRLEEMGPSYKIGLCHKMENPSECWRHERSLLGATALRHMMQLRCNAQAVMAHKHKDTSLAVQSSEEVRIATALFPILSLLNHSCSPNTSISFGLGLSASGSSSPVSYSSGVRVTIRVCRDIAAGQELLHCYGPHCSRMHVKERQLLLMEQYFFHCHCEACNLELADEASTLPLPLKWTKCEKCGNSLQMGRDRHACSQSTCDHHISNTELQRRIQILQKHVDKALELIENQKVDDALRVLQEVATQADSILMKTHPLQGEIADAMARVYALMGNWRQAALHLKCSVVAIRCQYGEDSVELGKQLFKLTQLHFNGGDGSSACSVIPLARRILSLHCDLLCEELQELQAMEACLYSSD